MPHPPSPPSRHARRRWLSLLLAALGLAGSGAALTAPARAEVASPAPSAAPRPPRPRPAAPLAVRVPGLSQQAEDAVSEALRPRLEGAVRTLWTARREPEALAEVRFPEPRWQARMYAVAERGQRVCKLVHRLPVVLRVQGGAERQGSLMFQDGEDRVYLEVEGPEAPR